MKPQYHKTILLFAILSLIAAIIYFFSPSFSKGLFVGLGVAAVIYVIREFLPKRK
ncbi:hypothetical protein ACH3O9_12160 [Leeuwenhoekiella sp. A16]|uniref:hypothetical protein n=1 Tax=unclassified Leeuwenhoekiella TaxID=2615029 RepID=UPI003A80755E